MRPLLLISVIGVALLLATGVRAAAPAGLATSADLARIALTSQDVPGFGAAATTERFDFVPEARASYGASWQQADGEATIFIGLTVWSDADQAHTQLARSVAGLLHGHILSQVSDLGPQGVGDEDNLTSGAVEAAASDAYSEQFRIGAVVVWIISQDPSGGGSAARVVALAHVVEGRLNAALSQPLP